ncbi:MAG: hypothetical protein JNK14_19570 [Chitinophagaceae bacterium]|nr:hypothetical protein [Chitinophagaceae bacterium]
MNLLVIGNGAQKDGLYADSSGSDVAIDWINDIHQADKAKKYDGCIDLLFENRAERIGELKSLQAQVMIVNAVVERLDEIGEDFIRINGWPTFLERNVVEAACRHDEVKDKAENIFSFFGKTIEWVPDISGFISARVIAVIINEAYLALEENISDKAGIDTAMKLGTNYPFGPFEWSHKIGLKNVYALLAHLAREQKRYEPAALLIKEAKT